LQVVQGPGYRALILTFSLSDVTLQVSVLPINEDMPLEEML